MHRPIGIYKYNDQQISTMSASDAGGLQLIKDDVSKYVKLNVGGCLFQTTIGTDEIRHDVARDVQRRCTGAD